MPIADGKRGMRAIVSIPKRCTGILDRLGADVGSW